MTLALVGYEVLDTGGSGREPPSPDPPTESARDARGPEVVAYDDLPPVTSSAAQGPARARLTLVRHKAYGGPALIAAAVVLLAVGWAVGDALATRHADRVRAAERASQLAVMAAVTRVDPVPGLQVADFTVRLQNAGPLPVSLVLSGEDDTPTTTTAVVRPLGGAAIVPAGGSLYASLRLAVECTGPQDLRAALQVPLRTQDGAVHRVAASDDGEKASVALYGNSPCSLGFPSVDATVAGTLDRPLLRLRNTTDHAVNVRLDAEDSPFVAHTEGVLRLRPALPLTIAPRAVVDLAVTLTPSACPQGLSVVLSSQVAPYVVLVSGSPAAGNLAQDRVGVDLSTLWGVALARRCR